MHDGPQVVDEDNRSKFKGKDQKFPFANVNNPVTRYSLQTLFFAPWNSDRGNMEDSAPSMGTTFVSLFLTFVSCLSYGWIYGTVIDQGLASGLSPIEQAIIFAFVSGIAFILTMNWTWEPTLPTQVNWGILFASIGTFDIGFLPFLLVSIFMLGGFAAGGGIIHALGLSTAGPTYFMPDINSNGAWLYWFLGTVIIFNYIFLKKWLPREDMNNTEDRYAHYRRVIMYTGLAIFMATVGFRKFNLYFFDAGLFITTWAATGVSNINTSPVLDWAFFWFVPLASAAAALLLYYIILLLWWWSTDRDNKAAAAMGNKIRMNIPIYTASPHVGKQKLDVFRA